MNLWGLTVGGNQATTNFVGGGTPLTANGQNQINILQTPISGNFPMNNGVLSTAVAVGPSGSPNFATLVGGSGGLAVIPLPSDVAVTSFAASNPDSNVEILNPNPNPVANPITVTLDRSRTVNALLIGPGVTVVGPTPPPRSR